MGIEFNKIYNENCLETMARMPDCFIDLTVTSPPYDNLRDYKGYSFPFEDIAKELYRVTKQGGVVVWIVSDATINGSETGTSFKQALFFKECGFNIHDTMIWFKDACRFPDKVRYYDSFEYMFIFSKGKPKTINLIDDKLNKWGGTKVHGTNRMADNSTKRLIGHNKRHVKYFGVRYNLWKQHNVGKRGNLHPATFPEQLINDHIISWSNESDLIYDCFMGSGTTGISSIILNRKYIGSEISNEYCNIAQQRISEAQMQTKLF